MLVLQAALKPQNLNRHGTGKTKPHKRGKIGLAIAGGGPIGGMYELGALRALEQALVGVDLTDVDVYVGVSSGAFLAAALANRLDTSEMCRIFITGDSTRAKFHPEAFLRPAFREYFRRATEIPSVLMGWIEDLLKNPTDTNLSEVLGRFGALIPTGLFDNSAIEKFLRDVFESAECTNDFRKLRRPLSVVAVDLDSGTTVRFGSKETAHVPISKAIQASSALPGLYPPVEIDGKLYVDGALRRTLHASVALDAGADIVIGLNPLVPFDASLATLHGKATPSSIARGGLPMVLSQTFRTLLRSRMQVGFDKYQTQYERADLVLFEPNPDDAEMFFTNVFSYTSRRRVVEHAYQSTLRDLRERRKDIEPILNRHGISLNDEILNQKNRGFLSDLKQHPRKQTVATASLRRALDELEGLIKAAR